MPTTYHTDDEFDALIQLVIDRDFPTIKEQGITVSGVLKSTTKGEDEPVASMLPPAVLKKRSPLYSVWDTPPFFILFDLFVWQNAREEAVAWIGNALEAMQLDTDENGKLSIKFAKPDLVVFHASVRKYGAYCEALVLVENAMKSGPKADEILGIAKRSKADDTAAADPEPATPAAETDGAAETDPTAEPARRRRRGVSTPPPPPSAETGEEPETPAEPASDEPVAEPSGEEPPPREEAPRNDDDDDANDGGEEQPASTSRRRVRRGR